MNLWAVANPIPLLSGDDQGRPAFDIWTQTGSPLGTIILETEDWPDVDSVTLGLTHILGKFVLESGVEVVRGFPIPDRFR